jgi:flagellar motor switch protein FliN/FliY
MAMDVKSILKVEVPMSVLLAQKLMNVEEILALSPGSVIQFNKNYESNLHLLANGKPVGLGVAVKVNEKFGLQVKEMGHVATTINALGS